MSRVSHPWFAFSLSRLSLPWLRSHLIPTVLAQSHALDSYTLPILALPYNDVVYAEAPRILVTLARKPMLSQL